MPIPTTMNAAIEANMQRKLAIYREWRAMGVCHADAVDSGLQNSCWGPALRVEFRRRCEQVATELQ